MSSGGWRYGAGRPGEKAKAEACCRLDVRLLRRAGLLEAGSTGFWAWSAYVDGAELIGTLAEPPQLWVQYAILGRRCDQRIELEYTACTYGGTRPWFSCPCCRQRAAVLYLRNPAFACRRCSRVAYESQSQNEIARSWAKQRKAESRLAAGGIKPRGMHGTTYAFLRHVIEQCEHAREEALMSWALNDRATREAIYSYWQKAVIPSR